MVQVATLLICVTFSETMLSVYSASCNTRMHGYFTLCYFFTEVCWCLREPENSACCNTVTYGCVTFSETMLYISEQCKL